MIAKPSIAFNDFSGTAKDVTARSVNGRNILSVRAQQSKIVTPAQAVSRNKLSKISRAYKQLSDSQMTAWGTLASHLKGISTFGSPAELTPHNAFVRINSNRAMVGMPLLTEAPVYKADVPEVLYEDLWISPDMIVFTGLEVPSDTYRLVVKMSPAQSPGTSSGWSKTVIVAPGIVDDWGEANITKLFTETIGVAPQAGMKYYLECWWLDTETGFTGESMWISAICKEGSTAYNEAYVPRARFTQVSIHVNAAGNGSKWLNAAGWSVYTCKGQTASDKLAECLCQAAIKNFPGHRIRTDMSDGDMDWEEGFYILRKSLCVAVLTENFFMDSISDLEYLQSRAGKQAVVDTHVEGIVEYLSL